MRQKISDKVRSELLGLIDAGTLTPGEPLPSERALMERFKVGRPRRIIAAPGRQGSAARWRKARFSQPWRQRSAGGARRRMRRLIVVVTS